MSRDEIIRLARDAGIARWHKDLKRWVFEPGLERFATFVAAAERESIMDEWQMCVQSDLENGVKLLNERAAEKWHKEYPAIAGFDAAIRARGTQ